MSYIATRSVTSVRVLANMCVHVVVLLLLLLFSYLLLVLCFCCCCCGCFCLGKLLVWFQRIHSAWTRNSFRILDLESMYDFKSLTHTTSYFPTRPEFSLRWLVIASQSLSFDHPALILISRSNGMSSLSHLFVDADDICSDSGKCKICFVTNDCVWFFCTD